MVHSTRKKKGRVGDAAVAAFRRMQAGKANPKKKKQKQRGARKGSGAAVRMGARSFFARSGNKPFVRGVQRGNRFLITANPLPAIVSSQEGAVRVSGSEIMATICAFDGTGGHRGCLRNSSGTYFNAVGLTPGVISQRLSQIASLFNWCALRYFKIRLVPYIGTFQTNGNCIVGMAVTGEVNSVLTQANEAKTATTTGVDLAHVTNFSDSIAFTVWKGGFVEYRCNAPKVFTCNGEDETNLTYDEYIPATLLASVQGIQTTAQTDFGYFEIEYVMDLYQPRMTGGQVTALPPGVSRAEVKLDDDPIIVAPGRRNSSVPASFRG